MVRSAVPIVKKKKRFFFFTRDHNFKINIFDRGLFCWQDLVCPDSKTQLNLKFFVTKGHFENEDFFQALKKGKIDQNRLSRSGFRLDFGCVFRIPRLQDAPAY